MSAAVRRRDDLETLCFECFLVAVAALNLAQGLPLSEQDRKRLVEAAARIESIATQLEGDDDA